MTQSKYTFLTRVNMNEANEAPTLILTTCRKKIRALMYLGMFISILPLWKNYNM